MLREYGRKLSDGRWHCPASERNKEPILRVLTRVLPQSGLILEIGSGTGQHLTYFAEALPELTWQPTDPDAEFRESMIVTLGRTRQGNVRDPLDLDVLREPWPVACADGVVCINFTHVAPWEATRAFFRGAACTLSSGGVLFLYGPFRRFGRHTSPSNEAFDRELRKHSPDWGLRNLEVVVQVGEAEGLAFNELIEMPANNFSLIFCKPEASPRPES